MTYASLTSPADGIDSSSGFQPDPPPAMEPRDSEHNSCNHPRAPGSGYDRAPLIVPRNRRCQAMDKLLDLRFDWFATRTHFRVETNVYIETPGK